MKKFLLLGFLIVIISGFSNKTNFMQTSEHTYFFCSASIDTKEKYKEFEELLNKNTEVVYFNCQDFPAMYFKLVTKNEVSKELIESWTSPKYTLDFFGVGEKAEKQAYIHYRKNKK